MLRRFVFLFCFVLVVSGHAQTLQEQLNLAINNKEITDIEALVIEAKAIVAPQELPIMYRDPDRLPVKSATDLCFRIFSRRFEPKVRNNPILKLFFVRPTCQTSMVSQSGFFRIHYDTTGYQAVSNEDADNNGILDYVEAVAAAFDTSYTVQISQIGFDPPPGDNGLDGNEYDVYIRNLSNIYGQTFFEKKISGSDRWITYIEIDNNYLHTPTRHEAGMQVTAAHEFFHAVQLGYVGRDDNNNNSLDDQFLMEAASTWMEDVVYDDVNDYYFYLNSFFRLDNINFDSAYGIHQYGLCVWFHFLEIRTEGRNFVKSIWEKMVGEPAMPAMAAALREAGLSIKDELTLFRGWNYFTDSRAVAGLYYPEASFYPQVRFAGDYFFRSDTTFDVNVNYCAGRYFRFVNTVGDTAVIIPVHSDINRSIAENTINLQLIQGNTHPEYFSIGSKFTIRLNTEHESHWSGAAVTTSKGGSIPQVTFFTAGENTANNGSNTIIYPNPFKPAEDYFITLFPTVDRDQKCELAIFTPAGMRVFQQSLDVNSTTIRWNGVDQRGRDVPSGVYIAVLLYETKKPIRGKFVLIR